MKRIILALISLITLSAYAGGIVDIEFTDNSGAKYRTTTLQLNLEQNYGQQFPGIKVLLIETPSLTSKLYLSQYEYLNALEHEEFQVMYVVASRESEIPYGYHTTVEGAQNLAEGDTLFRVRLLNANGEVLNDSNVVLLTNQLRQWFSK